MKKAITPLTALPLTGMGAVDKAWDAVSVSFDRFCLTAGIEALGTMMEQDAEQACGARHARSDGRRGHRWGRTQGDVPAPAGAGVSKSAASRHFVALSAARMQEWMGADLSGLDIMVVQIDGIHISEHLVLVAALGIDSEGFKHPLGLMEGATEHSAVVQALIDDLIERR